MRRTLDRLIWVVVIAALSGVLYASSRPPERDPKSPFLTWESPDHPDGCHACAAARAFKTSGQDEHVRISRQD
jgi:hypothetical protein